MRLAVQTIIWGRIIYDLPNVLNAIAALGFTGVEFAQRPSDLRKRGTAVSVEQLMSLLKERNLQLVGFAGGSLQERWRFCKDYRPEYLYIENWEKKSCTEAERLGFSLALHPHAYKRGQQIAEVERSLREHPHLMFLPDTAHLAIENVPISPIISKHLSRIKAIHFKDWSSEFGRSSHRYARGFVELGRGILSKSGLLTELLAVLEKSSFSGWIIVEQDSTQSDPIDSLRDSLSWARQHKSFARVFPSPLFEITAPSAPKIPRYKIGLPRAYRSRQAPFFQTLLQAQTQQLAECYETILRAFKELVPSQAMSFWTCTAAQDLITLLAIAPVPQSPIVTSARGTRSITSQTIDRGIPMRTELRDPANRRRFAQPGIVKLPDVDELLAIPIFNPYNNHHVRYLLNIFPKKGEAPKNLEALFELAQFAAIIADATLDQLCLTAQRRVTSLFAECKSPKEFIQGLPALIRSVFDCEGVGLFLVDPYTKTRLELVASSPSTIWSTPKNQQYYRIGEGYTGRVWLTRQVLFQPHMRKGHRGKSFEKVSSHRHECLFAPICRPDNEVIGVVRCRNKKVNPIWSAAQMFSDDDAAVLEALLQAATPYIDLYLHGRRTEDWIASLTHDLREPLTGIQTVADTYLHNDIVEARILKGYFDDIFSYCQAAKSILRIVTHSYNTDLITTQSVRANLMSDILEPALKFCRPFLSSRRLAIESIDFSQVPPNLALYVDKTMFQEAIYQLISNAITYRSEKRPFSIEVAAREADENIEINFRDWGIGIDSYEASKIFERERRGSKARSMHTSGMGLGLWITRRIVESHQGVIKLIGYKLPTEFQILLPSFAKWRGSDEY